MKISLTTTPHLIISAPTGIIYSNQSGGMCCTYPEAEGYLIPFESGIIDNFNDCELLCWLSGLDPENNKNEPHVQERLKIENEKKLPEIHKINEFLSTEIDCIGYKKLKIQLNLDKLDELVEGWWPVKGRIEIDEHSIGHFTGKEDFTEENSINFTGYIAKQNCD